MTDQPYPTNASLDDRLRRVERTLASMTTKTQPGGDACAPLPFLHENGEWSIADKPASASDVAAQYWKVVCGMNAEIATLRARVAELEQPAQQGDDAAVEVQPVTIPGGLPVSEAFHNDIVMKMNARERALKAKLAESQAAHVDALGRETARVMERDALRARAEAAEAKLAEAEPELARWRNSFDGLVFVKNEKYAELVADRDRLAAEVTTLHARIAELESRECAHAAYAAQEAQMKQDDDRDRLAAEVVDLQRQQKASDDEIARVNGERDKLLANISALKAALKRYDDASAEVERLRTQLQATEKLRQMDNEGLAHWCAEAERLAAEVEILRRERDGARGALAATAALKALKVKLPNPLGPDEYGEYSYEQQPLIAAIRAAGVEVEP